MISIEKFDEIIKNIDGGCDIEQYKELGLKDNIINLIKKVLEFL